MKRYSIILLPEFKDQSWIEQVRRQYDPIWNKIPPHISLVFPFETDMTVAEIERIMEFSLYQFRHFDLEMSGLSRSGRYIHLNVGEGYDHIYGMYSCLYSTILASYKPEWLRKITYIPQMSLAKLATAAAAQRVLTQIRIPEQRLKTVIRYVYLEEIGADQSSDLIVQHKLRVL